MNNIKKIAGAVALLGCAVSGVTQAQSRQFDSSFNRAYDSPWYIAPSINAIRPDKRFGDDHHGRGFGLRFGKIVSPAWDLQFGPTHSRQRYKGVAANRLATAAKGEANPIVVCNDKNRTALIRCLEPNRRVEVEQIVIERRVQ